MAVFDTRTFGDGVNTYFTLTNEEFVRKLGVENSFKRVKIGILCAIQGSGNFVVSQNGIGLCTAGNPMESTLGHKSPSTTNWIGTMTSGGGYGLSTHTYNVGPPDYYSQAFSAVRHRIGSTYTNGSGNVTTYYHAVAGSGCRSFMILDVTKSGPTSFAVRGYYPNSAAQAQINWTMQDLVEACEEKRTSLILRNTYTVNASASSTTLTATENNGRFDAFSIYWNSPAVPFEV
jgi:hypothetical protein